MPPVRTPAYLPTFCLHFLLPNTLLGVLALAAGGLGAGFGIPYLIWHDDPAKQLWVGFGLALVALQALYIGFLLWGKKAGRPERLALDPGIADRVNSGLFARYCAWVIGQLAIIVVVLAGLVLLVQTTDDRVQGPAAPQAADTDDMNDLPPPRPNYGPWLPLGGVTAALCVFLGGWAAKHAIRLVSAPKERGAPRWLMTWLAEGQGPPTGPPPGGLLLALWAARTHGSPVRRLCLAAFNQTLCVLVGVVFAAVWELSHISVATAVAGALLFALVAVRARWLNDARVFRVFLLLLGCLAYFVVTWLGSREWCGWPGAFAVTVVLAVVVPVGARGAFPGPTARLLQSTNERIIAPDLCRRYPFHAVAALFFLFGAFALFALPMAVPALRSPMVLGCFLAFMVLSLYGFVAYAIDDALPYLAPALLAMVVLSGLPQYKMRLPGLDYAARPTEGAPVPLLDLQAAVDRDVERRKEYDQAVARELAGPGAAVLTGGAGRAALGRPEAEADRRWADLEDENRVLPGRDTRPGAGQPAGRLLALSDVAFASVPAEIGTPSRPGKKKPMVVVVASGGGIRAAAWTFLVLSELEARFAEEGIPFPYHVRLITGASGGMFGASYYVRSLRPPGEMTWGDRRRQDLVGSGGRLDKLTGDWLTPLVERLVTNDVPGFLSPFPSPTDRGVALEQAWSKGLDGDLDMTFADLADRERAGWCPSLAFSPMMIEDGRRLLVSNLDLRHPASNDGHLLGYGEDVPPALADLNRNYSHDALELFRLFPRSRDRFTVATAVRMSASFPYLSPAVPLPTKPRRRVVDAGYFDNYGVSLAAAFLFSQKNGAWFRDNVSKIVLVQIRDGQSEDERRLEAIPDARRKKGIDTLLTRSVEELTSPVEGLTNGRVGTSSFRNDGLLELLSIYFERERGEPGSGQVPQAKRYFTVVNFEFPGHVALSWHLSAGEKGQMRATFRDPDTNPRAAELQAKIAALLEWWKADVYDPPADDRPRTRVAGGR